MRESSTGGPCSDYSRAVRLLEAVYEGDEVETVLNRFSEELDDFFRHPEFREQVVTVADLLAHKDWISGEELQELLVPKGTCGVWSPDMTRRCELARSTPTYHATKRYAEGSWTPKFDEWPGIIKPDWKRIALSQRSKRWKRVTRITSQPPPDRPLRRGKVSELEKWKAIIRDPAATRREQETAHLKIVEMANDRRRDEL